MMKYKGYFGRVQYDDEEKKFRGEVLGINDTMNFQGKTVEELEQSFKASIDVYLDLCGQRGEKPEKTFSGTFNLRIDPDLHAKLSIKAKAAGMSLNSYIAEKLKQ